MLYIQKIIFLLVCVLIFFIDISCIAGHERRSILITHPILITPFKSNVIDWKFIILNTLQDVLFFNKNIESDAVLLVNMIKNDTNSDIQTSKVTNLLINYISENTKKYKVICIEKLYFIYRKLGIYPEDHINSYNFSINIANCLKADYLLYGIIHGDILHPILELRLILVKTGEILCVV